VVKVVITSNGRYLIREPTPPNEDKIQDFIRRIEYGLIDLNDVSDPILRYYVDRELRGFSILDPLLKDPDIEDIHILGDIVRVVHRKYGMLDTNIKVDADELVLKLGHRVGSIPTEIKPLLVRTIDLDDAIFRVSITRKSDISPLTSITLRRIDLERFSIPFLISQYSMDSYIAALIASLILLRRSIIFIGPPKSGKTTLLRSFLSFIPSYVKIVIIQSAGEIILKSELFDYESISIRELYSNGGYSYVDLFDNVIRSKSPGFLVIGEVRIERDFWAFLQASLTRLGAITTMHAESDEDAIEKMSHPPYGASRELIMNSVDALVVLSYDIEDNRKWVSSLSLVDYNDHLITIYRSRRLGRLFVREAVDPYKLIESRAFERAIENGNPMLKMLRKEEKIPEFIIKTAILLEAITKKCPNMKFSYFTKLIRHYYSGYKTYAPKLKGKIENVSFKKGLYKNLRDDL